MSDRANPSDEHRTTRSHLSELLIRRDQLGAAWAEAISHALPATSDLTVELMVAEATLADTWPHLADRWAGEWATADVRRLHNPDAGIKPGCSICARRSTPIRA